MNKALLLFIVLNLVGCTSVPTLPDYQHAPIEAVNHGQINPQ